MAGARSIIVGQATVDATAGGTLIVPAQPGRAGVIIENLGTTDVYIGVSGVTTATGFLIPGTKGANVPVTFTGAIYGITGGGSATLAYWSEQP